MASPKGLKRAAELAGLIKKGAPARKIEKGSLGPLDDLSAYDEMAGKLEADDLAANPQSVINQIEEARLVERETTRVENLSPKSSFGGYRSSQAITPEEYSSRVPQFRRKSYVEEVLSKADGQANMPNPLDTKITFEGRYDRWRTDSDPIHRVAQSNTELQRWAREGAYKRKDFFGEGVDDPDGPLMFFRMDIRQDPRVGELPPIQFDPNANEFGMHIGSRQAGKDIISPEVGANMNRRFQAVKDSVNDLFDNKILQENGVDPLELFEEAFVEMRTNMFLRHGEDFKATPAVDQFKLVLEDFFEELKISARSRGLPELAKVGNAEAFQRRMLSIMRYHYDPLQHPVLTNVKQGLLVKDLGPGNTAQGIAEDLLIRGSKFDEDELQAVVSAATNADANIAFRDILRKEGYDHLAYLNDAEDRGVLSIVLFDEVNYQNVYEPTINRLGGAGNNNAALAAMMAPLAGVLGLDDAKVQ